MLKPLHDYLLFKPFPRKDSEIIIVINKQRMHRGEVIAVGPGRYEKGNGNQTKVFRPLDVKVGDIVNVGETPLRFPTYTEGKETYWVIQEGDVAFIEESTTNG